MVKVNERLEVLLDHIGITVNGGDDWDVGVAQDPNNFEEGAKHFYIYGGEEWAVLTEEEADDYVAQEIDDMVGFFNPDFLSRITGLDLEVFEALSGVDGYKVQLAIKALVEYTCGMDDLVEAAIEADGRGHFISSYDGEEVDAGGYLLYRIN